MSTENAPKKFKTLFLCTGNSARSIMAEYLLKRLGAHRFEVFSAGSKPAGVINPFALKCLRENYNIDASGARSKSLDEFKDAEFDFVITVCDSAKESCPVFPGRPIVAHWSSRDPAAFEGTDAEKDRVFFAVSREIYRRLDLFTSLPLESLDRMRLEEAAKNIGAKKESV